MRKVKVRGSARMKQLGHTATVIWLTPAERNVINRAATRKGERLATYIRTAALSRAAAELQNSTS